MDSSAQRAAATKRFMTNLQVCCDDYCQHAGAVMKDFDERSSVGLFCQLPETCLGTHRVSHTNTFTHSEHVLLHMSST